MPLKSMCVKIHTKYADIATKIMCCGLLIFLGVMLGMGLMQIHLAETLQGLPEMAGKMPQLIEMKNASVNCITFSLGCLVGLFFIQFLPYEKSKDTTHGASC